MKYYLIFYFILFSVNISGWSQNEPWGMNKWKEYHYVDETEITVSEWLEFYYYSIDYDKPIPNKKYLPYFDSLSLPEYSYLFNVMESSEYLIISIPGWSVTGYGKYPIPKDSVEMKGKKERLMIKGKYMDYPITNISYEQAKEFCDWRTRITEQRDKEQGLVSYTYSLPTKEDFNEFNLTREEKIFIKKDTFSSGNYLLLPHQYHYSYFSGKIPFNNTYLICASFNSNNFGLFDVQGNVSEMLSVKGKAMGGNYSLPYSESLKDKIQYYNSSQKWLGFRCVAKTNKYNK